MSRLGAGVESSIFILRRLSCSIVPSTFASITEFSSSTFRIIISQERFFASELAMVVPNTFSLFLAVFHVKPEKLQRKLKYSARTILEDRKTCSWNIRLAPSFTSVYLSWILLPAILARPAVSEKILESWLNPPDRKQCLILALSGFSGLVFSGIFCGHLDRLVCWRLRLWPTTRRGFRRTRSRLRDH